MGSGQTCTATLCVCVCAVGEDSCGCSGGKKWLGWGVEGKRKVGKKKKMEK